MFGVCKLLSKLSTVLEQWKDSPSFMSKVTRWEVVPAKEGCYREFPEHLDHQLVAALKKRKIARLYSHQYEAIDAVHHLCLPGTYQNIKCSRRVSIIGN